MVFAVVDFITYNMTRRLFSHSAGSSYVWKGTWNWMPAALPFLGLLLLLALVVWSNIFNGKIKLSVMIAWLVGC